MPTTRSSVKGSQFLMICGMGQGQLKRPSSCNTRSQRIVSHDTARVKRPISNDFRFTKSCHPLVRSCVPQLLSNRDPTTVRRFIVSVVVYSVNGEGIVVAVTHCPISEGSKRPIPFWADGNPSRSIILVGGVGLRLATLAHRRPCRIQTRWAPTTSRLGHFSCATATTTRPLSPSSHKWSKFQLALDRAILTPRDDGAPTETARCNDDPVDFKDRPSSVLLPDGDKDVRLRGHHKLPFCGVTPPAVTSSAEAHSCLHSTRFKVVEMRAA